VSFEGLTELVPGDQATDEEELAEASGIRRGGCEVVIHELVVRFERIRFGRKPATA
jgi:hypothetical protein